MRRKLFSKVIAMIAVCSAIIGLVACGNAEQGQQGKESTGVKEEGKECKNPETSKENQEDGNVTSYPLDTEIKLSMWCGAQLMVSEDYSSWKESPFHAGLAERTGVEIDWIWPAQGATVDDSYNLLWLDSEIPDIVYHIFQPADGEELINDNAIWDLTEYLPEYAPNYWEWLNSPENEAERNALITSDGKFYCIPAMRESDYNLAWVGPIIRKDWLDECNLEMPVTLDDWKKVLLAFKEKYNANLGYEKVYCDFSGGLASGTGSLGFSNTLDFRVTDGGEVVIPQMMPEWVELMEIVTDWWNEGLIDHDCLTADKAAIRSKALNNEIGISFVAMSGFTEIVTDAENENTGANWVGLSYPRTEAGAPTTMIASAANRLSGYGAVITKGATEEELKTALQWLDYGWTEEGKMYWNFGEEGVSYTLDENGKVQWTDTVLNDPKGLDFAIRKYSGTVGSAPVIQLAALVAAKNAPVVADAVYVWSENTEAPSHLLPPLQRSVEDNDRFNNLWTQVQTYLDEECMKMLVGERPLSEYEDMMAKANELGLKEVLEIQNKYYKEYVAK